MTSKHTLGPWKAGNTIHTYKDGQVFFATVFASDGPEWGKIAAEGIAPTKEMAEANARLIAAAPDLLDACLGMVETLAGYDAAWLALTPAQRARAITMKAAIAKAIGEQ